jgi:sugar-specific transcriptional regulator TrmB
MNLEVLTRFGIHENDVKIYKALLTLGRSKTGPIMKCSNLRSSAVYDSIKNLLNKGLVSYQVRNNIKYYKAESPLELVSEADKNKQELIELSKSVADLPILDQQRNEVNVYEGEYGFKMAFTNYMQNMKKGEVTQIISFSARSGNTPKLRAFLNDIMIQIANKKCYVKALRDRSQKELVKVYTKDKKLQETRFLPSSHFSPTAINISPREVLISVWGKSPIVFSIRSKQVIDSYINNFQFLWGLGKTK